MPTRTRALALLTILAGLAAPSSALAQNSSLYHRDLPLGEKPLEMLQQGSWTFIPMLPPEEIRVNDIVIIRVDEIANMKSEGDIERRKDAQYDAILQDWVELLGLKAIKPSPQRDGDQRIKGKLQQLFRAEAELETRESLALNIAAKVVDIRPNGNLVLEAHKRIRINDETWEASLSGVCRRQDVGPDRVVLSRNIVDLQLDKRERGHVRDGYKRGWLLRWLDEFHPF